MTELEHGQSNSVAVVTRELVDMVDREILESTLAIARKHGLHANFGVSTFNREGWKCSMSVSVHDAESGERADFARYAIDVGLKPSDLGAKFIHRGLEYTIHGYDRRSRKYPIIAIGRDGKTGFQPVHVKSFLAASRQTEASAWSEADLADWHQARHDRANA